MTLLQRVTKGRPRVLTEVAGAVRFEHGSPTEFGTPDKAAILVQWSREATLSRSFTTLATEFAAAGYRIAVVSACEDPDPLEWHGKRPEGTVVIRKPNFGYDFGSAAVALDALPAIADAQHVALVNDSMIGPFAPLAPTLKAMEARPVDVQGLTDTRQYFQHLQSYFLLFTGRVLRDAPLARFFRDVRIEPTKWDIIRRYELGLSVLLRREGYSTAAAYRADDVVSAGYNPVITGWWKLLEMGFPFVKREILRNPDVAPRGEWVSREVSAVFGERVQDWI